MAAWLQKRMGLAGQAAGPIAPTRTAPDIRFAVHRSGLAIHSRVRKPRLKRPSQAVDCRLGRLAAPDMLRFCPLVFDEPL
jgi:hypothetical protein